MRVQELMEQPPESCTRPVYLFCPGKGPRSKMATFEPLLAERTVERIAHALIDPENRDFAYAAFYADETPVGTIVAEAQTLPFLAERRVIVVRNVEKYESESGGRPLFDYLASPSDFTVLLLVANKVDRRTKLFKACKEAGDIVECAALNEGEAMDWVRTEARILEKTIEDAAVREIVSRTGTRLGDVNNALVLVSQYIGEAQEEIREEDVIAACADVAEEEIWALTDAIAASRTGNALVSVRRLIDLGKHPDEIIGTINWLLKSTYAVTREDPDLSRFVANKVRPLAQKLGRRKLPAAFALCTDTQFNMRNTGVDATLAVELLVAKLAAPVRRAGRA
ncbi:MAG: DNA polymerase III subunit delta [Candidatus Hydrogenedentes bacterium]|nr:DNA polymerase III subunit delta [Candidatus Hydrogenedentota bacterium]